MKTDIQKLTDAIKDCVKDINKSLKAICDAIEEQNKMSKETFELTKKVHELNKEMYELNKQMHDSTGAVPVESLEDVKECASKSDIKLSPDREAKLKEILKQKIHYVNDPKDFTDLVAEYFAGPDYKDKINNGRLQIHNYYDVQHENVVYKIEYDGIFLCKYISEIRVGYSNDYKFVIHVLDMKDKETFSTDWVLTRGRRFG